MGMTRWTVRSVNNEAVEAVRALQAETGVGLGEILSVVIRCGLDGARKELARKPFENLPLDGMLKRLLGRLDPPASTSGCRA
jgi:hypothetical protein